MTNPSYVNTGSFATGTTSVTPTPPTHVADDILIAIAYKASGFLPTTVTSGWTKIADLEGTKCATWWWKRATGAGTAGPTFTASGASSMACAVVVVRGCHKTATPYENAATAGDLTSSDTTPDTHSTATGDTRLVMCLATSSGATDYSSGLPPSGWTANFNFFTGSICRLAVISKTRDTGTESAATVGTLSASQSWGTLTLAWIPTPAIIVGSPTAYTMTGNSVTLRRYYTLATAVTTYTLTGNNATLSYLGLIVDAAVAVFNLVGKAIDFIIRRTPPVAVKFHTFEVMESAIVNAKSSQQTLHPAEHAITPLEPNFAWEANEASVQHTLTLDLTEIRTCDGFTFMHHETETLGSVGLDVTVQYSLDNTTFYTVPLVGNAECGDIADTSDSSTRFKMRYFANTGLSALQSYSGRYWKFTFKGLTAPNYYAPTDMRVSVCWLFTYHALDRGPAYPINHTVTFPSSTIKLGLGKTHKTGHTVNLRTTGSRLWQVNDTELDLLETVLEHANGRYRPVLVIEANEDIGPALWHITSDGVERELLDIGIYRAGFQFATVPLVGKDSYH